MSTTYSINTGLSTESIKYPMVTISDVNDILQTLYDNTDKMVVPSSVRNAVLSTWASSAFKQTTVTASSISYIGVDSGDPSYRDVFGASGSQKIFLGKRDFLGNDIMSSSLLNSQSVDVFFFNTKPDTISNNSTRLLILSGTNTSSYINSPYLQSQFVITGTNSVFSLDIVNENDINFVSSYDKILLNEIVFPTISESVASASNDKVLEYYNGDLIWDSIVFSSTASIGSTSSPTSIFGTPVTLNGYPLEFTDSRPIPITFNDITIGSTFSSYPIVEMLRRMIYPYLPPICTLSIDSPYEYGFAEIGTNPSVKLTYSITKRTYDTLTTPLGNMIPSSHPSISSLNHVTVFGSASGVVISPITSTPTVFSVFVNDGTQSNTSTASISGIYPYFYGIHSSTSITTTSLSLLTKLVDDVGDKTVDFIGTGYVYFIYPDTYPLLSTIIDNYGNTASFTYSTQALSSPSGLWSSKIYKVYRSSSIVGPLGPPSVNYQFKY